MTTNSSILSTSVDNTSVLLSCHQSSTVCNKAL